MTVRGPSPDRVAAFERWGGHLVLLGSDAMVLVITGQAIVNTVDFDKAYACPLCSSPECSGDCDDADIEAYARDLE